MPRFAANLSMLFTEVDFPERFAMARAAGFEGVEYLFPYAYPKELLICPCSRVPAAELPCRIEAGQHCGRHCLADAGG